MNSGFRLRDGFLGERLSGRTRTMTRRRPASRAKAFEVTSPAANAALPPASVRVRRLLVFGPGVGLAFTTASIAALAGVPERESGLASGLSNTSFQVGAALGVAIVSTVAVSRTDDYLAANGGANPLIALTEGFQSAFLACAVLAGVGATLAVLLLGRPRQVAPEQLEPAPAPAGD
jgi:predicted MFS family arabinose efflux permease